MVAKRAVRAANKRPTCLACKSALHASSADGLWLHPPSEVCAVRVTDEVGLSLDDKYEVENGIVYAIEQVTDQPFVTLDPEPPADLIMLPGTPTPFEPAIHELFDTYGIPRLGGASGDMGWSSFSSFQRCPYLWKRRYLDGIRENAEDEAEPFALVVGSLIHTFAAVYYQRMIDPGYPLDAELVHRELYQRGVNPDALSESMRVWEAYQLNYHEDYLKPLALEHHAADPRTGESCRFDMIAEVDQDLPFGFQRGTVIVEHKTTSMFTDVALTGWVNDGEIIGQIMLYNRLKLYKRFGPLQGVIVNILGKQKKAPMFHRTFVSPNRWQTSQHAKDLQSWHSLKQLYIASNHFPRARNNCVHRFGKCSQWEHCATGE
jgi:hypothetical protein